MFVDNRKPNVKEEVVPPKVEHMFYNVTTIELPLLKRLQFLFTNYLRIEVDITTKESVNVVKSEIVSIVTKKRLIKVSMEDGDTMNNISNNDC